MLFRSGLPGFFKGGGRLEGDSAKLIESALQETAPLNPGNAFHFVRDGQCTPVAVLTDPPPAPPFSTDWGQFFPEDPVSICITGLPGFFKGGGRLAGNSAKLNEGTLQETAPLNPGNAFHSVRDGQCTPVAVRSRTRLGWVAPHPGLRPLNALPRVTDIRPPSGPCCCRVSG